MNKIVYKSKIYNTYKEIWKEYNLKCNYGAFTRYIRNHGLEEAVNHFLNFIPKEKIVLVYKGKEYTSYRAIWKEYGIKNPYDVFTRYIRNHGLEKAINHYLNLSPKEKIVYKGKEHKSYKEILKEYGLKCSFSSFTEYIRNHSIEEAVNYYTNFIPKEKIVYKGKEYKSYKEIWEEYELKCDYSSFTYYIKNNSIEEAVNHFLNFIPKEKKVLVYKGKEYNTYAKLWKDYKDRIHISYKVFNEKLRLHLDNVEGFMDLLLEED